MVKRDYDDDDCCFCYHLQEERVNGKVDGIKNEDDLNESTCELTSGFGP